MTDKEINKELFLKFFTNKKNLTIMDIGTYDGKDSIEFSKLFPKSKIYSFEADKRSVEIFKEIAGKTKNIKLIQTALSNIDGEIEWYASKSDTRRHYDFQKDWSASSSLKKPAEHLTLFKDVAFTKLPKIKSTKLDTWMQNKHINHIDIMWVDVNGGEFEFLEGAMDTINNKVDYLYIEFTKVDGRALYDGAPTKDDIKTKLKGFEELGVYNFKGNFGNLLLKNKIFKND
tara:strand:- start:16 stop:705 length:690 start_codon:yes stop_codon:yes gene_type:complete